MAEDALVRRDALVALLAQRGYKDLASQIAYLAGLGQGRDTYWRDLLAGRKSFGEKKARALEQALTPPVPRGFLDIQPSKAEVQPARKDHAPPPPPPSNFADRHEVSDSDWATLEAVKLLIPEHELAELRARAGRLREQVLKQIGNVNGKVSKKE